ncbi:type IV secretion protein Rhs, partial [Actinokineospora sp.]|uniref:type IV secretion protein Rhs n=1 Tax=Actinokineospora sp. TaxID=1872133 RepID=UPI004037D358
MNVRVRNSAGRVGLFGRAVAAATAVALLASSVPAVAAPQVRFGWKLPELQKEKSVPVTGVSPRGLPTDPAAKAVMATVAAPSWPGRATARVTLSGAVDGAQVDSAPERAGETPVSIRRLPRVATSGDAERDATVTVTVADQGVSRALGVHGLVFSMAGVGTGEPLRVDVDYSSFGRAFGGDYAARLRLVKLPACALTTPQNPVCRAAEPVSAAKNDLEVGVVSGEVTLQSPVADRSVTATQSSAPAGVFAVTAAPGGVGGAYTASSLAPAGSWTGGGSAGDFTYGYPMRVPPPAAGSAPTVSLGYSSQSLDGRTSATNNQASVVGDGWDLSAGGFIERSYKTCSEDLGGTNGQRTTGDNCWATDNATISLAGVSGKLVKDSSTGVWRARNDDGARIERFTGSVNGDNDGEYWKVTTPDGTQYFLGMNRLPGWIAGKPETRSAWTVPVYGNNGGEPCAAATFEVSWCQQAYRWNLDYIVDPHGNVTSYYYSPETNFYGRNLDPAAGTSYVRGGHLDRIEYGLRSTSVFGAAAGRVLFETAERCIASGSVTCDPAQLNAATAASWPDVPADQLCAAGEQCTNRVSPTFFTRKRLNKVTAQAGDGSGGYRDVDSWTLTQDYPDPGARQSTPVLNLRSIVRTGHVGSPITLPPTTFDRTAMRNRVDTFSFDWALTRYRITGITNETGAYTSVRYSDMDCDLTTRMPSSPESNTLRCYPSWWTPEGATEPVMDWFHKYVVTDVTDDDRTGASSLFKVHYDYLGGAAWHHDENDFAAPARRTWSLWRGYDTVRTVTGEPSGTQSVTEGVFLRGMDGDRLPSGTRSVFVSTSEGEPVRDVARLQGFLRESRQYSGGQLVAASVNDPWVSAPTATGTDGSQSLLSGISGVRGRTLLESGAWRRTAVHKTFDGYGLPSQVEDLGDLAVAGDESCTRTTYVRNTTAWLLTYARNVQAVTGTCAVAASATTIRSEARSSYDGQEYGVAPTRGGVTKAEALDAWDAAGQRFVTASTAVYDALGRPVEVVDASGEKTTTAYTPTTGPVTSITSTNPLGHVSTVYLEPAWNATVAAVDPNNRRTDMEYDALGRLARVWSPGHLKGRDLADAEYVYSYNTNAPSVVATKQLQDDNRYLTAYTLYDGLLRKRQTQTPAPGGGRLITDMMYDSRGLAYKQSAPYYNDQPASGVLAGAFDWQLPNQTITEFDGLARPIVAAYRKYNVEQWRTTTAYGGDRVHNTPPAGGTATTLISDAQGRTVQKRQYTGAVGSSFDTTTYAYTPAGHLAGVTDAAGNRWGYGYDLRGRKITTDDPDSGHSAFTYDAAGRMLTSTDARGKTLAFAYDRLGRTVGRYDGSTAGTKLAEWEYDTVKDSNGVPNGLGMPALSRRWSAGNAYTDKVTGYDSGGRVSGRKMILPNAAEGVLGTTYEVFYLYTWTGKLQDTSYRAAVSGGVTIVPADSSGTYYNSMGLPETLTGAVGSLVSATTYSPYGEVLREVYDREDSASNVFLTNEYELGTRRLARSSTTRETATSYGVADRAYSYDPTGNITRIAD